jgi:phosphatidylinositol 4-kinase
LVPYCPFQPDQDLIHQIVSVPVEIFTPASVSAGAEVWSWLVDNKPEVEERLMTEISLAWNWTMRRRKGFFSKALKWVEPLLYQMFSIFR